MTTTETITDAPSTTEQAPLDAAETETPSGDGRGKSPGAEAAKYRVQRNEAREALTAAEARIQALQTREVLRHAAELAEPEDLLSIGEHGLADFLTEDGEVNPEAVSEAVSALIEGRPGLARNPRVSATDTTQGSQGGGKPAPTFADLFKRD